MNSFIQLLLFSVVAAVLFASSDPTVSAAPAGEQVSTEPSKGNDVTTKGNDVTTKGNDATTKGDDVKAKGDEVKAKADDNKAKGDDNKDKNNDKNKGSFLDIFPGKDKNKSGVQDMANNISTKLKDAWSGLQNWFNALKIAKISS